ncbi:class I SAM-dependent methyltransferase [Massilia arenosa]|uniref:Class I SAM-dependent methyltransferase n=1 Tax=Zemynaea arenosa TaxID=2561931 RepID=A0A4Y9RQD6_9BURK|nr:class I SAM-dependent methyltransferase [Massilia arenosa]TFW11547.1 class I SAM-dependent methyltransferase [Massilia arenosa]
MSSALRRFWTAPAIRAALVQAVCFPLTLALVFALARAGLAPGYPAAALIQGVLAAALTWRIRLAAWWWPIQFLFPVLVLCAQWVELSPWLYLGCFLFMLVLYWSTFRTQVPYYPSGPRVWEEVEKLLPPDRPARVIDIGSGLGGLALHLARQRPDCAVTGIELAPLPWFISRLRAVTARGHVKFIRGDYEHLNFAHYDVVFAYLSPAAMSRLWIKASQEMRSGAILLSYEFNIAEKAPSLTILPKGRGPALHVWHF